MAATQVREVVGARRAAVSPGHGVIDVAVLGEPPAAGEREDVVLLRVIEPTFDRRAITVRAELDQRTKPSSSSFAQAIA